jgi:hypothetical protein
MGPVDYRLDDIMAVQDLHILDCADPSPDMAVQKWSAWLVYDQRCRVGEFAQAVELMSAKPDIHPRWLIIDDVRASSDEFIEQAWK